MATTPNMTLDLPVVSTTPGPTWATAVNAAFDTVDTHDHSTGNGVKITPTGLNINADLPLNENNVTEVRSVRFEDQGTVQTEPTDLGCLQLVGGDLWWVNGNGTGVQITSGAGLSFASLGTIGGDFGQPGVTASITYSDITKIFSFLQDSGITAGIYGSKLLLADASSGALSVTLVADAATGAYTLTFPISAPTADTVLTFNGAGTGTFRTISGTAGEVTVTPSSGAHTVSLPATITKNLTFSGTHAVSGASTFSGDTSFSGLTSGRGIVPLGAVLATFPSLTGAYACSATTAADSFGFVQCAGQTLVDATSPMNGAVIPNINNNAFLMGNATSGSAGGSNTKTLTTTELPAHAHDMSHGHSNTFALTGTTTFASDGHTHNMAHSHQWAYMSGDLDPDLRSTTSASSSQGIYTTGGTNVVENTTGPLGSGDDYYRNRGAGTTIRYYTTGALNNSDSVITNTGSNSASASIGFTGSVTSFSGSTGSSGSGSSFDIRPSYISARYVMRVK
jgi:hypothetical protein